ncbi:LytTR family DNA-binding domain-containing protein [Rugamonas sp. CCM 8940]|uniref:LytTR family DNA-binding domain-containing protein n=1 Tax=Rugamonas sp. CCM 8940 TaxID=2765359 RepID=UPI0018F7B22F|nr:LytTR family DNA-binding domain-containing protein [Rugamonas sp. CCM 8940]MBJ7312778.1 LytTR family transcriptional regulator [Rugamonas sp. CCM 8940]
MLTLPIFQSQATPRRGPPWLRRQAYAYAYWLAFLLVLEPGNVLRAHQAGHALGWADEVLRIAVAALLGSAATPLLLVVSRRFPLSGPGRWRHLLAQGAAAAALAFALIAVAGLLAAWFYQGRWLPTPAQLVDQLVADFSLLLCVLAAYLAFAHAAQLFRRHGAAVAMAATTTAPGMAATAAKVTATAVTATPTPATAGLSPPASPHLTRVEIKALGRISHLDLATVDWIETQGNYVALHVGTQQHLVRDTLLNLEARLDPRRFVRIHRRMLVALDRIEQIETAANGDAVLHLAQGTALRVSRNHRAALRTRWQQPDVLL